MTEPENNHCQIRPPDSCQVTVETYRTIEDAVDSAIRKHEEKAQHRIDEQIKKLEALVVSGFPNSDPKGHCEYHQKQIDYMNERIALWREVRNKSLAGIVWLLLALIGSAILEYVKKGLTK